MAHDGADPPTLEEQPDHQTLHGDEQSSQEAAQAPKVFVRVGSVDDLEKAAQALLMKLGLIGHGSDPIGTCLEDPGCSKRRNSLGSLHQREGGPLTD
jgi:hypothetical protein